MAGNNRRTNRSGTFSVFNGASVFYESLERQPVRSKSIRNCEKMTRKTHVYSGVLAKLARQ